MNEPSRPMLTTVPPIEVPFDPPPGEESTDFIDELLDFKIKRAGTYGRLTVACALYLVGVLVIHQVDGHLALQLRAAVGGDRYDLARGGVRLAEAWR